MRKTPRTAERNPWRGFQLYLEPLPLALGWQKPTTLTDLEAGLDETDRDFARRLACETIGRLIREERERMGLDRAVYYHRMGNIYGMEPRDLERGVHAVHDPQAGASRWQGGIPAWHSLQELLNRMEWVARWYGRPISPWRPIAIRLHWARAVGDTRLELEEKTLLGLYWNHIRWIMKNPRLP